MPDVPLPLPKTLISRRGVRWADLTASGCETCVLVLFLLLLFFEGGGGIPVSFFFFFGGGPFKIKFSLGGFPLKFNHIRVPTICLFCSPMATASLGC